MSWYIETIALIVLSVLNLDFGFFFFFCQGRGDPEGKNTFCLYYMGSFLSSLIPVNKSNKGIGESVLFEGEVSYNVLWFESSISDKLIRS